MEQPDMPKAIAMTNPKRDFSSLVALFWLLSAALTAQAENAPSPANARFYSLGEFNRLDAAVSGDYTVAAYFVGLAYFQCKPDGVCPTASLPVSALISDTPRSRITHAKVKALLDRFNGSNVMETGKALDEVNAGYAFRVLNLRVEPRSRSWPLASQWEARYCLRIRAMTDTRYYSTGLVLEDFGSEPDCGNGD
jgi:hypothetical protein